MKSYIYNREMNRANANMQDNPDYWSAYKRGLQRRHLGPSAVSDSDHFHSLSSLGYRDGYYGPVDWNDIPATIRIIRTWRGWSTEKLGALLVRSGRTIERWEQGGVNKLSPQVLEKIRELYYQ